MNDQIKLGLKFVVAVPVMLGIGYLVGLPGMPAWRARDFENPMFIFFGLGMVCTVAALGCAMAAAMQLCAGCISGLGRMCGPRRKQNDEESEPNAGGYSPKAADGLRGNPQR